MKKENLEIEEKSEFQKNRNLEKEILEKPELLAPVGSKASWAAAVMAGADAIYLGLNDFSARTYADNFSLVELSGIIKENRKEGIKTHVAFNSLIKETELEKAYQLLATVADLGADAFIIQDLGLAKIAKKYFPKIPRHASTLTAIHSLPGLAVLQNLGFKRAVLARELALDEIKALSMNSPIEVEIFIHGALCFSVSGLCLMSSFLGGRSALRGGCTQPCRRNYQTGRHKGAFFSVSDFNSTKYIHNLKQLPIKSFKIEGRMKGPDYVSRVVSAYRMLIDAPLDDEAWQETIQKANSILLEAPGRRQTSGLLATESGALSPLGSTTSGLKMGSIEYVHPKTKLAKLKLLQNLKINDRLRLQLNHGEESPAFNIKTIILNNANVEEAQKGDSVSINLSDKFENTSGFLFKVSSGQEEKDANNSHLVKELKRLSKNIKLPPLKTIPSELRRKESSQNSKFQVKSLPFWFWLEKAEDIYTVLNLEAHKVILNVTPANLKHIKNQRRNLKTNINKIIWSLPPLIFYQAQIMYNQEISNLLSYGFTEFMVSNLAQINMLQRAAKESIKKIKIWGDHRLGFLNHQTEFSLIEQGLTGATISLEADRDNYNKLWQAPSKGERLIYMYGRPALFTSRYKFENTARPIVSPRGEKFYLAQEGGEMILQTEKAIFMAPLLKMPPLNKAAGLIIDLKRENQIEKIAKQIKNAINSGRLGNTSSFNFRRGLF